MRKIKQYAPQLIFLCMTSTLCMTYFVSNVVAFQFVVYFLIFILFILSKKTALQHPIALSKKLFVAFAIFYIIRVFVELELLGHKQELYANNSTVYYFLITGMLLPAFFVPRIISVRKSYNLFFIILAIIICVSLLISLHNIFSGNIIFTGDHRIQGNERLGVIQYGHLGLTGSIIGYICLRIKTDYKIKAIKVFSIALIIIGFVTMLMAGTRGALISAIVIVAIYLLAHAKISSFIILAIVSVVLFLSLDFIESVFDSLGAASVTRIMHFFSEGGDQSSGRTDIWIHALQEIIESPIVGVSCFWNSNGDEITYVHNSFIEVTYALGIFGLFIFTKLNWVAIKGCIASFKSSDMNDIAFSFLYLQYFTYTLFSESVIRVPLYWYFLLMMLNIRNRQLQIKKQIKI